MASTNLTDDRHFVLTSIRSLIQAAWNWVHATFLIAFLTIDSQPSVTWQTSLLISIVLPNIPPLTTLLPFRYARFSTLPCSFIVVAAALTTENIHDRILSRAIAHRWVVACGQRFVCCQDTPRQAWPNRVHKCYGLFFHLKLLPTLPHGNAVIAVGYRAVT